MKKLLFVFVTIFSLSSLIAKEKKGNVYVELFGSFGTPHYGIITPNKPTKTYGIFGAGGGINTKYIRAGLSLEYNTSSYKYISEYTDYLGNRKGNGKYKINNQFIMPSISISTNFGIENVYPILGISYGLPFFTKHIATNPLTEKLVFNRSDILDFDSTSYLKIGQSLALKAGIGYESKNQKMAIEASFRYQTSLGDGFFIKNYNSKKPYQIGGQLSLIYNFRKKTTIN